MRAVVTRPPPSPAPWPLDVITSTGKRMRGQVVGSNARSGVAVISTAGGLEPATFADEDVEPSDIDIMACLCAGTAASSSSGTATAAVGMVQGVGTGVRLDSGIDLVKAIEAEMPLGPTSWGGVLLDSHGHVLGILDGQMNLGNDTVGLFVPAPLAEGVALELAWTSTTSTTGEFRCRLQPTGEPGRGCNRIGGPYIDPTGEPGADGGPRAR